MQTPADPFRCKPPGYQPASVGMAVSMWGRAESLSDGQTDPATGPSVGPPKLHEAVHSAHRLLAEVDPGERMGSLQAGYLFQIAVPERQEQFPELWEKPIGPL